MRQESWGKHPRLFLFRKLFKNLYYRFTCIENTSYNEHKKRNGAPNTVPCTALEWETSKTKRVKMITRSPVATYGRVIFVLGNLGGREQTSRVRSLLKAKRSYTSPPAGGMYFPPKAAVQVNYNPALGNLPLYYTTYCTGVLRGSFCFCFWLRNFRFFWFMVASMIVKHFLYARRWMSCAPSFG